MNNEFLFLKPTLITQRQTEKDRKVIHCQADDRTPDRLLRKNLSQFGLIFLEYRHCGDVLIQPLLDFNLYLAGDGLEEGRIFIDNLKQRINLVGRHPFGLEHFFNQKFFDHGFMS